ncbi:MAG: PfkB family carbohydrate kinase [Christensenella sp.]|uniref:PfkB family carbohydrate kinase n=1 Tax=Christensenella sp. TaxID=1935934 RepID=UPI002B21CB29|nr:PfkB family carbohydrate kinase [Christensenella sp.]MEA5004537.1 PfkB family carbohydrate kinase [Christensenella sp.]
MKNLLEQAIQNLEYAQPGEKTITLGFDGCSDSICRAVRKKDRETVEFFETMAEFGDYLSSKSGVSCSIELDESVRKPGGNCAIFASAVSECNVNTSVIGLFGKNQINEVFDEMREKCELYSYGNNAIAMSLEFRDGKVMLSPNVKMKHDAWEQIISCIGEEKLKKVFADADMLALVNWSELEYASYLWEKLYDYLAQTPDKSKEIFVDLADCSRRSKADIREMLDILEKLATVRTVILSLNENEAMEVGKMLFGRSIADYQELCQQLGSEIAVDGVVLHSCRDCYSCIGHKIYTLPTQFNKDPKLLTGAGDNFNAGYALGRLCGAPSDVCNVYGNAMSSYYITHGESPNIMQLKEHIKQWYSSLE